MNNPAFIQKIVALGFVTSEDAQSLREKFKGDDFEILRFLHKGGVASKGMLGKMWGDAIGYAYVDLVKSIFQPDAIALLRREFATQKRMIPLYRLGSALTVATANPLDLAALEDAARVAGMPISPVFTFPEDIEDALQIQYQSRESVEEFINKIAENALFKGTSKITDEQLKKIAGDKAVVDFTSGIILLGIKERATDIHIDPSEEFVRIRFRIDGLLQTRLKMDLPLLAPVASRLKVMASLDITEKRRPQDGRISLKLKNRAIDIRFSSAPALAGEKIVLRLLGQLAVREIPSVEDLDFSHRTFHHIEAVAGSPNGVFLVTGPTGSGKTTTLFSVLKRLNTDEINILTVEDPVEYRLEGVNQVQANAAIGLDFAAVLRSFLRQDPDVMLIGEIRDLETAKIACQAALTGHMVLATLHSNTALQATTRLLDIGVPAFIVSPALMGVMSQRLVRRICESCKTAYPLSEEEADRYFIREKGERVFFYKGKGCIRCNFTGYMGRIALHEIFLISNEIRDLISRNASLVEIERLACMQGFKPLYQDGLKKVLRGLTTMEEVERVMDKTVSVSL
ncbi:GspE/PulE family protein [Desulfobotulus sp.]|jgi:type IV pilus assembly protein PilB|uniref:GspE/PulE family protein n=1 Tax=Desulfobotulus sp. TaxID=1940337 RepID=UPI002A35E2BA|nr:GspE/PulE family protein [Desulfobotulus sp.]MDY0163324.1 GspE/PulE family protein [Desulfobotulus sp.]